MDQQTVDARLSVTAANEHRSMELSNRGSSTATLSTLVQLSSQWNSLALKSTVLMFGWVCGNWVDE